jgi:hypothetical protein
MREETDKPVERMIALTPAAFAKQAMKDGHATDYAAELIRQHELFAKGSAAEITRLHACARRRAAEHEAEIATLLVANWLASL